jgi:hypothetical protein
MNFYGSVSGPQHTIYGRIVPLMEAMRLAICRAANCPPAAAQASKPLPEWAHRIADELTCTVFKGIVQLAPAGKKHEARTSGQLIGLHIRLWLFYSREMMQVLEREGLTELKPEQQKTLETLAGWELACAAASKQAGRPIQTKGLLLKFYTRRGYQFVIHTVKVCGGLVIYALKQPVTDVLEFLSGIPEGFKCFLDTEGGLAKRGQRTEIFFTLLMYWPEIEEIRQAQPPRTRRFLLQWLEAQEAKRLVESERIFLEICDDISLDVGVVGHPQTTPD